MTFPQDVRQDARQEARHGSPFLGLASLARIAFAGGDLTAIGTELLERTRANATDANAWMDLSIVAHLRGDAALGLAMQEHALTLQRDYRLAPANGSVAARVLALLAPGDLSQNNALEFLVEGSDIQLDLRYVDPGVDPRPPAGTYDLTIVAVGESDHNRPLLEWLATVLRDWPTPVLDSPARIAELTRDRVSTVIGDLPGTIVPPTVRVDRATAERIAAGSLPLDPVRFPLMARPVDSHKGAGLERLDDPAALAAYLDESAAAEYFIASYVDCSSDDGQFRKYRVLFIDGRPYLYHLAISSHHVVHYMSAGMAASADKRAEEAHAMQAFDQEFGARHAAALAAIADRIGLAYFGIDCAETRDGRLVVFEADASLTIHAMDPVDLYPYKPAQFRRITEAFRSLVLRHARRADPARPAPAPR